jgi:hypothetical protein
MNAPALMNVDDKRFHYQDSSGAKVWIHGKLFCAVMI